MTFRVLLVEDEKLLRWSLKEQLQRWGYTPLEAEGTRQARELCAQESPDLVLLDIMLPDGDGLELLSELRQGDPHLSVIIMTGHGNVDTAVEAMRRGAVNYLDKPFNMEELKVKIEKALEQSGLERELKVLRRQQSASFGDIVSASPAMRDVLARVARIAQSPSSTVLLTGESGTGKDMIARAIHAASDRASKPFMNITCSALPDQLLESELFGHERGAFTDASARKKGLLEMAHGGTVFLDELGETSLAFQAKLLRFLEAKCFKRVGGRWTSALMCGSSWPPTVIFRRR